MLDGIKKRLFNTRYFPQLEKFKQFKPKVRNISIAKSVGIIVHTKNDEDIRMLKRIIDKLEAEGKSVWAISTHEKKESISFDNIAIIGKNDINWIEIPKDETISSFTSRSYEVLLNVFGNQHLCLKYISSQAKADYRIGFYDKGTEALNDFMIPYEVNMDILKSIEKLIQSQQQVRTHAS